jgi:NTE family protein
VTRKLSGFVRFSCAASESQIKISTDSLQIVNINCNELDNYTKDCDRKLRFKPGAKITYKQLETGINNINATDNFRAINYTLEANKQGR